MTFIIIGAVLVLAAVGLLLGSRAKQRRLQEIKSVQTSTAAELADLAASVAKEIGAGSFNQVAEVKGTVECAQPLVSELSQTPCVRYSMSVTREYEERVWHTDSNGHREQRTERKTETVASNTRAVPFLVRDATGTISVEPDGASIVDEKVFSQFQQGEPPTAGVRLGAFSFGTAAIRMPGGDRRTIGYRFEEKAIPVGREIYVLGEAVDTEGRLRIRKPAAKGTSFIVSLKSEEQLESGAASASRGLAIGAAIAAVLGAAGIILGALGAL